MKRYRNTEDRPSITITITSAAAIHQNHTTEPAKVNLDKTLAV
jgi:hypothetical protein